MNLFSFSDCFVFTGVLGTHSGLIPCVLCHYTVRPLLQDPFSWQDPDICVGSFTKVSPKNNCTSFCSGSSMPITCLAPIVLISPVYKAIGPEGLRTFGPKSTSEDLKFLFLLCRQKQKTPVEVGISLDFSSF